MSPFITRIAAASCVLLALGSTTLAQPADLANEVRALRAELAELRSRVAELESALARPGRGDLSSLGGGSSPTPALPGKRFAYVDRVQTIEPKADPADAQRIAALEQELTQLEQTITQFGAQAAQSGARVPQVTSNEGVNERERETRQQQAQINAERRAEGAVVTRYEQQRARKAAELEKLRRRAVEPRQLIHGHHGDVLITLETEGDVLGNIQPSSAWRVVTWEGRLVSGDADSQHWLVDRIEPIEPPAAESAAPSEPASP